MIPTNSRSQTLRPILEVSRSTFMRLATEAWSPARAAVTIGAPATCHADHEPVGTNGWVHYSGARCANSVRCAFSGCQGLCRSPLSAA